MSEESARLRLPYIAASQAQKHVTHNEALTLLDTLCQASVIDKDLTTPPGSPAEGDCYIVAATGTGAWTGLDNRVVRHIDGEWRSYLPGAGSGEGWLVYVQDEASLYVFSGSAWTLFASSAQPLDADLTAIAGLSPSNDDIIQRKAGAWTNRTLAQLKTDLTLTKGDVGLGNVDNTSDINKPVSTAQSGAIVASHRRIYCRVMATGNINIATALNDGDVLNGVTLLNGDPVFLAFQTNPAENGIWIVFSTPFRSGAFLDYADHAGALISVVQGTLYAGTLWQCTNTVGGTLGVSALNFAQIAKTVDIQDFTSSGTWTKPLGAKWVEVILVGAGGGGGGGARTISGNASSGGGGGGGGARNRGNFLASDLGATVSATIGAAGSSGAGATVDGTAGADGGGGGVSQFGAIMSAYGGGGGSGGEPGANSGGGGSGGNIGAGGNATGSSGGSAGGLGGAAGGAGATGSGNTLDQGGGGGAGSTNGTTGGGNGSAASTVAGATGGGGGGGISVTPAAFSGGPSSHACFAYGAAPSANGGTATNPGVAGNTGLGKAGSGGGGGGSNTAGVGGAGGVGGNSGGGGGGGGSAIGGNGGAGGNGAVGFVRVVTYF